MRFGCFLFYDDGEAAVGGEEAVLDAGMERKNAFFCDLIGLVGLGVVRERQEERGGWEGRRGEGEGGGGRRGEGEGGKLCCLGRLGAEALIRRTSATTTLL